MNKTVCLLAIGATIAFYGNPTGMQIIAGQADSQIMSPDVLQVLTTDRSIIQWDTFSIGSAETMKFVLPDASAAVLNRVAGSQMSELMGKLEANGQVYLVNPSGIIVGPDAKIDASHFIASTFDVLNEEFIARADMLFKGDSDASIVNLGTISTAHGDCILLARHVVNEGMIDAREGVAALASATEILLKPDGAKRVFIQASAQKGDEATIRNSGQIKALLVEIQTEGNPYASAICHNGQIEAQGIKEEHGRVYLVASGGKVEVSGDIRATGAEVLPEHAETENFGEIRLLGQEIWVREQAMIDVSNPQGGGLIALGFEVEEGGERTKCLVTSEGTLLKADAMEWGDGGKILMWGADVHYFGTYVSAQGGYLGGDGGIVDASSDGMLKANGLADTLALNGFPGKLIYDPTNFTISATADANCEIVYDTLANAYVFQDTANAETATMNTAILQNNLALGNVVITTESSIGEETGGTISILSPISWSGATTLSLLADQDIIVDADVQAGGHAGVSFTSTRDLMIRGNISTSSGMVALTSHRNITLGGAKISTASGAIALSTTNYYDGTSGITLEGSAAIVNGLISIDAAGTLSLFGGEGTPSIIASSNDIVIRTGVQGASAALSFGDISLVASSITTSGAGNLSLFMNHCKNGLTLDGSTTAHSCGALIQTAGTGKMAIAVDGNIAIRGNGDQATCGIVSGGTLNLTVNQNCTLTSGTNGVTATIPNVSAAIRSSGAMAVNIAGSLSLEGGTGSPMNGAMASFSSTGNKLNLKVGGGCLLISGAGSSFSNSGDAFISSGGVFSGSIGGNLSMSAIATGANYGSVRISGSGPGETFSLTVGGSAFLSGGASTARSAATIYGSGTSALSFNCSGDLYLTAGASPTSFAQIGHTGNNSGPIAVMANNLYLSAGTGNGYSIIGHGSLGVSIQSAPIDVMASGTILMTGGSHSILASFAQIGHVGSPQKSSTLGGNISVEAGQSITLSGIVNVAGSNAAIGHGFGGSTGASLFTPHTVDVTAGSHLIMISAGADGGKAIIDNFSSQKADSIKLVCDHNSPDFPDYGASAFFFGPNSSIVTGTGNNPGEVSIYTAVRIFNTNTTATDRTNPYFGTINSKTVEAAAPLGMNSENEIWGVYPNTLNQVYPGGKFALYYKRIGGIMINGSASQTATLPGKPTPVTFTQGMVYYPVNEPEIWLSPEDIKGDQGLGGFSTLINAELLSPSEAGSANDFLIGNSILISGKPAEIAWTSDSLLTFAAGNDIRIETHLLPSHHLANVIVQAGRDCLIGNGTSGLDPTEGHQALCAQTMGISPTAASAVDITTGRDLILLDSLIKGSPVEIHSASESPITLTIGRDLSLFASSGEAWIATVGSFGTVALPSSVERNVLMKGGSGANSFAELSSVGSILNVGGLYTMIGGTANIGNTSAGSSARMIVAGPTTHTVGGGFTLTGGTGGGSDGAFGFGSGAVVSTKGDGSHYILNVTNGNLVMTGGVGGPATIQNEEGAANIALNVPNGNILMKGASGSINRGAAPVAGKFGSVNLHYPQAQSTGTLTIGVGGDLQMTGGAGPGCSVGIAMDVSEEPSNLSISVKGNLIQIGGSNRDTFASIQTANATTRSLLTLAVGGDYSLRGGTGNGSGAELHSKSGHYTTQDVRVAVGGNLLLAGNRGINSFAALTSGGGLHSTGMSVTVGNAVHGTGDIVMTAGAGNNGTAALKTNRGMLSIVCHGNLVMTAAPTGAAASPYIGSNENGALGSSVVSNAIYIVVDHNIVLNGSGYNSCRIGNGGQAAFGPGSINGAINVTAGRDIILNGASEETAEGCYSPFMLLAQKFLLLSPPTQLPVNGGFALIGHINLPAESAPTQFSGAVTATADGSIILNSGASPSSFARIGHGAMKKVGYVEHPTPPVDLFNPPALNVKGGSNIALNIDTSGSAQEE